MFGYINLQMVVRAMKIYALNVLSLDLCGERLCVAKLMVGTKVDNSGQSFFFQNQEYIRTHAPALRVIQHFLISEQLYMYSTQSDIVLSCRWLVM